jgi:hypothetical protein
MKKTLLILLFVTTLALAQSKTKITLTCEKDSISIEQLSKLIEDIQKLKKKYKLDIKIEFSEVQGNPISNGTLQFNGKSYLSP